MCGERAFTPEQGEKLNKALKLAKDGAALCLPAQLGKFISKDLEPCYKAGSALVKGETSAEAAGAEFIRNVPSWLRYASESLMLQDFLQAMREHPRLST